MKDSITTKSELDNLRANTIMISSTQMPMHVAKVNILEWAYNDGNLRTLPELQNKLQNLKEEIIALEYAQDIGISKDIAKAKLEQLQYIAEIE